MVTDSSGKVKVLFSDGYQLYGQDNGTPTCYGTCETYKFTGKPYSNPTGLYYNYHRWYDPTIGRFISPDPAPGSLLDSQSLNGYVYASNTPTVFTDPTGHGMAYLPPRRSCPDLLKDFVGWLGCTSGFGSSEGLMTTTTTLETGGPVAGVGIGILYCLAYCMAGLEMLAGYLRPPPAARDVIPPTPGGTGTTRVPTAPDPVLDFRVGPVLPSLGLPGGSLTGMITPGASMSMSYGWPEAGIHHLVPKIMRGRVVRSVVCGGFAGIGGLAIYIWARTRNAAQSPPGQESEEQPGIPAYALSGEAGAMLLATCGYLTR